ncbi:MAG: tetratricopeptide repeat protein [Acidobacteria bacterium]|nr:tetratricopeptide repeat protein [Acidobacteriota bacterium]
MTAATHRNTLTLSWFLLSLLLIPNLQAQRGGNTVQLGGHSLEIHILNESGAPLNLSLRVEVLASGGYHIAEAYSNREQGVAEFEGLADGIFQVRISGLEIEPVVSSFQIVPTESMHREYVRIDLKKPKEESKNSPNDGSTVSAQDLAVPEKARAEFERGMEAHAKGDDKAAQQALERALELYPTYVKAHNNLGVLYQQAGLLTKAALEYSKAVSIDPKFAAGYINLAKISIARGTLADAKTELKKALSETPDAVNVMVLLCSTEFASNEYPEALATARHIHHLSQDAQYADVHLIAAKILISQGKPKEAASEYQMFVTERPNDARSEKVKSLIAKLSAQQ